MRRISRCPCFWRSIGRLDLGASYDPGLMLSFYSGALTSFVIGIAACAPAL
ncbi:MAG: hypothetical protein R3D53_12975 [Paracoccaceae bacterium]